MVAVEYGHLEVVEELEKVEGISFETKNRVGQTLIEVARRNQDIRMLQYLRERKRKTLQGLAASTVASIIQHGEDIDALINDQHITMCVKDEVADFVNSESE